MPHLGSERNIWLLQRLVKPLCSWLVNVAMPMVILPISCNLRGLLRNKIAAVLLALRNQFWWSQMWPFISLLFF